MLATHELQVQNAYPEFCVTSR